MVHKAIKIREEDRIRLQAMPAVGRVQPDPYRGGRQPSYRVFARVYQDPC